MRGIFGGDGGLSGCGLKASEFSFVGWEVERLGDGAGFFVCFGSWSPSLD
jgi:hypothetical protein